LCPKSGYKGVGIAIAMYAIMLVFAVVFPLIMVLAHS
jgi:hypothetical protein